MASYSDLQFNKACVNFIRMMVEKSKDGLMGSAFRLLDGLMVPTRLLEQTRSQSPLFKTGSSVATKKKYIILFPFVFLRHNDTYLEVFSSLLPYKVNKCSEF